MANITITVQSLINTAVYDSYTIDNGQTVAQLKTAVANARGYNTSWFNVCLNEVVLTDSDTLSVAGVVNGSVLRTANIIDSLATKELKQKAKLDLAALDRIASGLERTTVDITELPTQYNDNDIIDNPNVDGLLEGRPWVNAGAFTFYEAINTTTALATTQYVSGNKIYAYSSSYDVPSFQNARIVVNDIEIYNAGSRGHTLALLDSNGNTLSITTYDTYGNAGSLTSLANALNSAVTDTIAVLVVWDASALNATVRSALTGNYGSTNSDTWSPARYDHIFIGIRA